MIELVVGVDGMEICENIVRIKTDSELTGALMGVEPAFSCVRTKDQYTR